jgi:PhzF family phenazine biosynthesis protein
MENFMELQVIIINAFSESLTGGNPAGVVLNSPKLTDIQMKLICRKLKVSETAFIFPSNIADYDVRFFSPEIEVNLCGHATIATVYAMLINKYFNNDLIVKLTQNTKIGIFPIEIFHDEDGIFDKIMMIQKRPEFKDIDLDISEIADSLNISKKLLEDDLPKQIVSTGLYTLPICVKSFKIIKNIKPDFNKIKNICIRYGIGSIHLFTFDTIDSNSIYHARNFAPLYGINEDPVTGTANGAVCSYLFYNNIISDFNLICEQGDIINRPGRVNVTINDNEVRVGGKAKLVEEKKISI